MGVGGAGLGDTRDVVALMGNGSNAYGYTTGNPLTTGVWHHVVSVFDGTQTGNAARLKVYVDNVQQTLTYNLTIPATVGAATNYHQIGLYGGTYYYKGLLDDMRLYNRALTAAEILQLYNLGK